MCHYCHANLVHFQFQYCTPTCYMYLLPICTLFHSDLFSTQFSKVLFTWHRHTNQFRSGTNIANWFLNLLTKNQLQKYRCILVQKTAMIDISFHWSNVMTVPEYDRANKPYDRSHWDRMYGARCPYLVAHCTWCGLISIHLPSTNVVWSHIHKDPSWLKFSTLPCPLS